MYIDSHVHLQPHGERPPVDRARLDRYVDTASRNGVEAICITEHLFRFREAYELLEGWWNDDPNPSLAAATKAYWQDHVNLTMADYVRLIEEAKTDGLPVFLGLEMDWIPGREDALRRLLQPYAWDVVLGSVHWIGAFPFDNEDFLEEWERRDTDDIFREYSHLLLELAGSHLADVLAHSDLPKLFGHRPSSFTPLHHAIVAAAAGSGYALE
ncbi:MAG: PHP domain-containing protein, partial [Dehalococcoidia bacterium]